MNWFRIGSNSGLDLRIPLQQGTYTVECRKPFTNIEYLRGAIFLVRFTASKLFGNSTRSTRLTDRTIEEFQIIFTVKICSMTLDSNRGHSWCLRFPKFWLRQMKEYRIISFMSSWFEPETCKENHHVSIICYPYELVAVLVLLYDNENWSKITYKPNQGAEFLDFRRSRGIKRYNGTDYLIRLEKSNYPM